MLWTNAFQSICEPIQKTFYNYIECFSHALQFYAFIKAMLSPLFRKALWPKAKRCYGELMNGMGTIGVWETALSSNNEAERTEGTQLRVSQRRKIMYAETSYQI